MKNNSRSVVATLVIATISLYLGAVAVGRSSTPADAQTATVVSTLEAFIALQDASDVNIQMEPGTYHISSESKALFRGGDWRANVEGGWPGLFDFTGSNNTFDLTGVTFTFDSTILREMPNLAHASLVQLGGTGNSWTGFDLQEVASEAGEYGWYSHVSGGVLVTVTGSDHEFSDLTVKGAYSHPYGFGSLYGKTGSSSGMLPGTRLGKKSALILNGLTDSTFDGVLVDHSAFGHTLFFDGPIDNVVVENATVIGETRSTNDLIANGIGGTDRNGVPFGVNHTDSGVLTGSENNATFSANFTTDDLNRCQSLDSGFQTNPIRQDYQFSLVEDAFRGYNQDEIDNLTIRNSTVVGVRTGIALDDTNPGLVVEGLTVTGVAGHGVPACDGAWNSENGGEGDSTAFGLPSFAVVENVRADAAYATVLEMNGDRQSITADVEVLDPENGYLRPAGSTALALISGQDHDIRLWKADGQALDEDLVIKVGNDNTAGIQLCNMTQQTVTLSSKVTDSTIYSIGDVIDSSNGSNTIVDVASLGEEPSACSGAEPPPADPTVVGQSGQVLIQQDDTEQWHNVAFPAPMTDPIVNASVASYNGTQPVHAAVRNVTEAGFEFQLEEWDYLDGFHAAEVVAWVAVERGDHILDGGGIVQAGSATVNHTTTTVALAAGFDGQPVVVGQVATDDGDTPVVDRITAVTANEFSVLLQTEEGNDDVQDNELVHWIAFEAGTHPAFSTATADASDDVGRAVWSGTYEGATVADIQTLNGPDTASVRMTGSGDSFADVFVQEETSLDTELAHLVEAIGVVRTADVLVAEG